MRRLLLTWLALCGLVYGAAYADDMSLLGVGTTKTVASGGATTTFSPSLHSSVISLSNGNLTAAINSNTSDYKIALSVASHSSGKFYFEATLNNSGGTAFNEIGVANASTDLETSFLGGDNNSAGAFDNDGGWYIGGSAVSVTTPSYAQADTLGVAFDAGAQLIWLRNASSPTTWNAGGTANPVTGLGGVSLSAITGPYYAAIALRGNAGSAQWTANFGATSYVASAPLGFGNM